MGPPLRATPDAWRAWWNDPDALSYYFMGKDNIVFHSQIWPAELLAYNGQGSRGGEPGSYGLLNLPTEVVSSEYLTMGDQQFSTSRGHVLYVGDFLARYGPDPLRYFICAAGPETSDAAFTWADFVTRNNSELVAGWGNLVNRTATMVAKSFGEIPPLRRRSSRSTRRSSPPYAPGSRPSASCSATTGCAPRPPRRCASSAR